MAATTVGRSPSSAVALDTTAAAEVSSAAGSAAPSMDTAVRTTAMGLAVAIGASARYRATAGGSARWAATAAANRSRSASAGQSPCQRSQATSKKAASSTMSPMS